MSPEEHAAMTAPRRRMLAAEPWRRPRVGVQLSADGTADRAAPGTPDPSPRPTFGETWQAPAAKPAPPERLTLWDQPADLWSTER